MQGKHVLVWKLGLRALVGDGRVRNTDGGRIW